MKMFIHSLLLLSTLILTGCQEKTKTVYQNGNGNSNPWTGGTGTCDGNGYWTTPGCYGYTICQSNPASSSYCQNSGTTTTGSTTSGTTTGTTTSGSTGSTTGVCAINPTSAFCQPNYCQSSSALPYGCINVGGTRVNCYINPTHVGCGGSSTTIPHNPNWGVWYPGGEPTGSCSEPYVPAPLTTAFETRKGTITIPGRGRTNGAETYYSPIGTSANDYYNTSELLTSVTGVKQFYLTDAILKFRIKVLPEPKSTNDFSICKGRGTADGGGGSYLPGYTKLKFKLNVYGIQSNGGVVLARQYQDVIVDVNKCSQGYDLTSVQDQYPHGVFVTVQNIQENKNCTQSYWNGWASCNEFNNVRSMECLRMELEVAADGTKTFD